MRFRQFAVTQEAVAKGRQAGLCGDVEKRISRMARWSAPFTHSRGNRRFQEFVLAIVAGTVVDITRLDTDPINH